MSCVVMLRDALLSRHAWQCRSFSLDHGMHSRLTSSTEHDRCRNLPAAFVWKHTWLSGPVGAARAAGTASATLQPLSVLKRQSE